MFDIDCLRFFVAFLGGSLLSMSGSLIQGITQNELSGPSTLGMVGLSVLATLIAFFAGLPLGLEISSFLVFLLMILAGSFAFYLKGKKKKTPLYGNQGENHISKYLLLGLCFNLFIGAIFSVLQFLLMAMNIEFPSQIWFGSFRFISHSSFYLVLIITIILYFAAIKVSKSLNFIRYGRDFALSYGIDAKKVYVWSLLLSLIAQGVVVSFFGVFAFLAIIFPHILRNFSLMRRRFSHEILLGAPLCGLFLGVLDQLCYLFPIKGAEIPVGMLSTVIGPIFLMVGLIKEKLD